LLREQKQAIINHAVTRGLDPAAPRKPSGVEWLGEIPAGWGIRKVATLCRVVRGASPRPAGDARFFGGHYCPWITVAEVTKDDHKYLTSVSEYLTPEGLSNSRFLESGTLVLTNSGATLGVPKILRISGCINDGSVAFLDIREQIVGKDFLYYFFVSMTDNYRERIKQGSGQPNLNTDIVKTTPVPIAPIDEQKQIVQFIEKMSSRTHQAIQAAEREIELMQEYRTTLISDVVTGKVDVRESKDL
jgi:type I restriction enzyme S subunit